MESVPGWQDEVTRREAFEAAHPDARFWTVPMEGWPVGHMGSLPVGGAPCESGPHGELRVLMDVMDALAERAAILEQARAARS